MVESTTRFRGGRQAQALRHVLSVGLSIGPDDCDRIALALGLAATRATRAGAEHPLKILAELRDLKLAPTDDDDDERGGEHDLSQIELPSSTYVRGALSTVRDADEATNARRALNCGYRLLFALYDQADRDAARALRLVLECVAAPGNVAPDTLLHVAPVAVDVELGREPISGQTVVWKVNREEGRDTSANLRIAGTQGKGKSQALLGLLYAIGTAAPGTGFVLLDYKGDLSDGQTGKPFLKSALAPRLIRPPENPIPINPFDLPPGANTELAAQIFSSTLASFVPQMGPVQEGIVDRALSRAYREAREGGRSGPSLKQARDAVRRQYEGDGRNDDSVTLTLDRMADKPIFTSRSEVEASRVFHQRWVVDLSQLGELRTYVAFTLLHFLRQVAQALPDAPFDPKLHRRALRGVIAVDEAHNYLEKGKKSKPLAELVRIGRSKGLPVFLSSQSLDDFKSDTAWRELIPTTLVFGHGAPPDTETLQGALHVDARHARQAAAESVALDQFVAFTHHAVGSDGAPSPLRITPFFERNKARIQEDHEQ